MTKFTPKTSSDAKKSYADPEVIDLLSTDETEGGKNPALPEDVPVGFGPDGS